MIKERHVRHAFPIRRRHAPRKFLEKRQQVLRIRGFGETRSGGQSSPRAFALKVLPQGFVSLPIRLFPLRRFTFCWKEGLFVVVSKPCQRPITGSWGGLAGLHARKYGLQVRSACILVGFTLWG